MTKTKCFKFSVLLNGHTDFPFDMLRYDRCWPANPESVMRLVPDDEFSPPRMREIAMVGVQAPTVARWNSFLCGVHDVVEETLA